MGNTTELSLRSSGSFSGVRSRNVTSTGPRCSSSLSISRRQLWLALFWLFAGEACRVTPRPLARMSHHSVVARLCFGRLAAPGGGRAARRLAAHCAASHHDHHGDDRGGRRHGSATAGATGSTHPGPSSAPAGDASRRVGRALQALRLEESRGHVDVRGARSLFSEYAASELTKIGTEVLPPGSDGRERWERRVAGVSRGIAPSPRRRGRRSSRRPSSCYSGEHRTPRIIPRDPRLPTRGSRGRSRSAGR